MFFKQTYFPNRYENRLQNFGDLIKAREFYLTQKPGNLTFLLQKRYRWMNEYISPNDTIIELGAGAGFSKFFIDSPNLVLTDIVKYPWIDMEIDALSLPFEDNSVDIFILSHMLHHLAKPAWVLKMLLNKLKPTGYLLIQDVHTSFLLRIIFRITKHEGWNYNIDIFNDESIANDPEDPWSGNNSIPELLFKNELVFRNNFPLFEIIKNELNECFIFPLSGGVIVRSRTLSLPNSILRIIDKLDTTLIKAFPDFFAMGRSVVLRKINKKL